MNAQEALSVVTYLNRAGLVRTVDGAAAVWADALHDVRIEDAQAACREIVRADMGEGRYVTPGRLASVVRRIRAARIGDAVPPPPPPEVADDPQAQIAHQRAFWRALGDTGDPDMADDVACRRIGARREARAITGRPVDITNVIDSTGVPE